MKSLFIVRTPFQLFNCIEAQGTFEDIGEYYLLCIYKKDIDRILMEKMIEPGVWKSIFFLRLTFLNRLCYPLIVKRFLMMTKDAQYCFFGLTTPLISHCINTVQAKKNVLLDDGNEIFLIVEKISSKKIFHIGMMKKIYNMILGRKIDFSYAKNMSIFSFFDLKDYRLDNVVLHNDYHMFKQKVLSLPRSKEVFFIGSNLIDTYMDKQFFEENMLKVVNYYKNCKVVYVLHRYEDKAYLESIGSKLGFEVIQFSMILEMALFEYGKIPEKIATFRSTALETLGMLYAPISMEVFEIDTERLLKSAQKDEYVSLYNNYRKKNIPLVSLKRVVKKAVLLNDTSYENHHGCSIVIKNIERNLLQRNIKLVATNPIGKEWKKNLSFLEALKTCDVVLVNAEGTIHHCSPYGLTLLEIVEATKKPCILMNMTYQSNSDEYINLIRQFTKVYVRESMSQKELASAGIDAKVVPDMTFDSSYAIADKRNTDIYITDSHDIKFSEVLYNIAEKSHIKFLPILAPYEKFSSKKGFMKKTKYSFFMHMGKWIPKILPLKYSYLRYKYVCKEHIFVEHIAHCNLLITARFHALCLAIQTLTPFIVLKSNTHKIEGLLQDMQFSQDRIIELKTLEKSVKDTDITDGTFVFTALEVEKIRSYTKDAKIHIEHMFNEIAGLKVYKQKNIFNTINTDSLKLPDENTHEIFENESSDMDSKTSKLMLDDTKYKDSKEDESRSIKRVGLVITNLAGSGAEKIVIQMARMFKSKDIDVHIFLLENVVTYENINDLQIHFLSAKRNIYKALKIFGDNLLASKLKKIVKKIESDGIKFDLFLSSLPAADRVAVQADLPHCRYLIHTSYSMELSEFRQRGRIYRANKKEKLYHSIYEGKDMIAVSEGIQEDLDKMGIGYRSCEV
ncbi:MAG: polysaccharide pyruvyl transferase family protein, partial [Bacteroidales bacterium]|nr:polysaccharide pyruvyl transferase family protein [Bacteroidales bacterium]